MEELRTFISEEFGSIRTVDVNGEPWLVGKDVAEALGYKDTVNALKSHVDSEDKARWQIATQFGNKETVIINESGLYSLVLSSKLPTAKKFRRWVTSEVLPSIRKHGGYIDGQENLSDDELLAKALIVAQNKIKERDEKIKQQEQALIKQKPLVEFANHVGNTVDTIDVGTLAKIVNKQGINIGRNRLFKWLRDAKVLMNKNIPYQEYIDRGYFTVVEKQNKTAYGPEIYTQTFVTGKGQIWIVEKLRNEYAI